MVDSAHRVFSLAVNNNFTQGRKAKLVCAACLYVACRYQKNPTMLIDFADLLQTDVYIILIIMHKSLILLVIMQTISQFQFLKFQKK